MRKIFYIISLLVAFAACSKQEKKPESSGKYSANFEIVAPLKAPPVFCPAALDMRIDSAAAQRIEAQAANEDGLPYSRYIHCRECSIGVFSQTKDSTELHCSYCGIKQPNN
jgi:hypothetical protein